MKLQHNIISIGAYSDAMFAVAATIMLVSFYISKNSILHVATNSIITSEMYFFVALVAVLHAIFNIRFRYALPGPLFYFHRLTSRLIFKTIIE